MGAVCALVAVLVLVAFFAGSITENCLSWAVRQRLFKGGALLTRPSLFADKLLAIEHRRGVAYWLAKRVPHFAWADLDGLIWQYTVRPEWEQRWRAKPLVMAWLALWHYDGEIVQGDPVLGDRWVI